MRNGYIDVIKFLFAVIVAEFHLNSGLFPGGRLAVDGFFMISAFLMMKYIEKNKYPDDSIGVSTVRFVAHKYRGLFSALLPSVIIGFSVYSVVHGRDLKTILELLPRLTFELFPLRNAGYSGQYVTGISWYLSSMFIALAMLYPLCKKFKDNFVLTVCPLLAFMLYGILCNFYGHLAVGGDFFEDTILNTGIMRALAASSLGLLLYEISKRVSARKITNFGRAVFTFAEVAGFAFTFYMMKFHPKSVYDYILVYVIFGLLIIGINGLSYFSYLWKPRWTKPLGTASTFIVLNHVCWDAYLRTFIDSNYARTEKAWIYVAVVAASSFAAYIMSKIIDIAMKRVSMIGIWKK